MEPRRGNRKATDHSPTAQHPWLLLIPLANLAGNSLQTTTCREKYGFAHLILPITLLGGYYLNLHPTDEKTEPREVMEPVWNYTVTVPETSPRQCPQERSFEPFSHTAPQKTEFQGPQVTRDRVSNVMCPFSLGATILKSLALINKKGFPECTPLSHHAMSFVKWVHKDAMFGSKVKFQRTISNPPPTATTG